MDIEGAEVSALAAAGELLARRPNLYVELHRTAIPRFGRRVEELAGLLPADGYATAGLWTAPDTLAPLTPETLRHLPANCGHVLMCRD